MQRALNHTESFRIAGIIILFLLHGRTRTIDILNKTIRACLQIFYLCFNALLEVGSQPFS